MEFNSGDYWALDMLDKMEIDWPLAEEIEEIYRNLPELLDPAYHNMREECRRRDAWLYWLAEETKARQKRGEKIELPWPDGINQMTINWGDGRPATTVKRPGKNKA